MEIKTICILLLLISIKVFSQDKNNFEIKTVFKTRAEMTQFVKSVDSLNKKKEFYEDENYIVYSFCKGEWGGSIIFKNKQTNEKFICQSTCPVVITKYNGKYIVTNTLNHLSGSTEILEIANPEKLNKATEEDEKRFTYEKVSQKGAIKLIDIFQYGTLYSFVYDEKLYHIISNKDGTYIAQILDGKFIKSQTVSDKYLWTYEPYIIKTIDKSIVTFNTYDTAGYLEISGNSITLNLLK